MAAENTTEYGGKVAGCCKCGNDYYFSEAGDDPGKCMECATKGVHVTKLSHGMVEKNTILSIWDVEHGEVYSVPKGISRENLEEFFRDLVERITR